MELYENVLLEREKKPVITLINMCVTNSNKRYVILSTKPSKFDVQNLTRAVKSIVLLINSIWGTPDKLVLWLVEGDPALRSFPPTRFLVYNIGQYRHCYRDFETERLHSLQFQEYGLQDCNDSPRRKFLEQGESFLWMV